MRVDLCQMDEGCVNILKVHMDILQDFMYLQEFGNNYLLGLNFEFNKENC